MMRFTFSGLSRPLQGLAIPVSALAAVAGFSCARAETAAAPAPASSPAPAAEMLPKAQENAVQNSIPMEDGGPTAQERVDAAREMAARVGQEIIPDSNQGPPSLLTDLPTTLSEHLQELKDHPAPVQKQAPLQGVAASAAAPSGSAPPTSPTTPAAVDSKKESEQARSPVPVDGVKAKMPATAAPPSAPPQTYSSRTGQLTLTPQGTEGDYTAQLTLSKPGCAANLSSAQAKMTRGESPEVTITQPVTLPGQKACVVHIFMEGLSVVAARESGSCASFHTQGCEFDSANLAGMSRAQ